MTEVIPVEQVAADDGIPAKDIARYQAIEEEYQTGLLPAAVWAAEMEHDAPEAGAYPPYPITWVLYAQGRPT